MGSLGDSNPGVWSLTTPWRRRVKGCRERSTCDGNMQLPKQAQRANFHCNANRSSNHIKSKPQALRSHPMRHQQHTTNDHKCTVMRVRRLAPCASGQRLVNGDKRSASNHLENSKSPWTFPGDRLSWRWRRVSTVVPVDMS